MACCPVNRSSIGVRPLLRYQPVKLCRRRPSSRRQISRLLSISYRSWSPRLDPILSISCFGGTRFFSIIVLQVRRYRGADVKTVLLACASLLTYIAITGVASGQVKEIGQGNVQPTPEIKRLYDSLAGDWDTTENFERTEFFPKGGERMGRTHTRLAAGGAMLAMEGHSDGSAGPLSYIIIVWWDKSTSLYRYFTCFRDTGSGCEARHRALGGKQLRQRLRRNRTREETEIPRRLPGHHTQFLYATVRMAERGWLNATGHHQQGRTPCQAGEITPRAIF